MELFETNNAALCVPVLCVCACAGGTAAVTAHIVDYLFGVN